MGYDPEVENWWLSLFYVNIMSIEKHWKETAFFLEAYRIKLATVNFSKIFKKYKYTTHF